LTEEAIADRMAALMANMDRLAAARAAARAAPPVRYFRQVGDGPMEEIEAYDVD